MSHWCRPSLDSIGKLVLLYLVRPATGGRGRSNDAWAFCFSWTHESRFRSASDETAEAYLHSSDCTTNEFQECNCFSKVKAVALGNMERTHRLMATLSEVMVGTCDAASRSCLAGLRISQRRES